MHHPPDLNLASSYIPACLCILKSILAFVLFVFSPIRGWIGLWCLLTVDRILWNQSTNSILDVNAVIGALIGGLMVMHTRSDNPNNVANMVIIAFWMIFSASQIVGLSRFNRSYEIILGACSVTLLACLYQEQERTELLALRSLVFVLSNVMLPYLSVMLQQNNDIDTYANACRTMLFLLGEPEAAAAWLGIYLLCVGYQFKSVAPKRVYTFTEPVVVVTKQPPALPDPDEQALLREALASRRGFRES
jgi:hypothetical protein